MTTRAVRPLDFKSLEKALGLKIKKRWGYESALTHPSFRYENSVPGLDHFDRMEFLGDAILNEVICHKIYQTFGDADEGLLSRLRSTLVSRRILVKIARELKLNKWMRLGRSFRKSSPSFLKAKVLADVFEALVAAIYFDRGKKIASNFILAHFGEYFDIKKLFRLDPNPKSTLQEISQRHWKKLPQYDSSQVAKGIQVVVWIDGQKRARAVARSRKEAEERAARALVIKLRKKFKV